MSASNKTVCGCGTGYMSLHDGKCAHCRTKKEQKALEQKWYQENKRQNQIKPIQEWFDKAIQKASKP